MGSLALPLLFTVLVSAAPASCPPEHIQVATSLQRLVLDMCRGSATFHRQSARIGSRADVPISIQPNLQLHSSRPRAWTTFRNAGAGRTRIEIWVTPGADAVEMLAHEFEHVIEWFDGVDYSSRSGSVDGGVQLDEGGETVETVRAIEAGRLVAREMITTHGNRPDPDCRPAPAFEHFSQGLRPNGSPGEISAAVSDDGRFVVFESRAALVPDDSNGLTDIYVADRQTNEVLLVSRSFDGSPADGTSAHPRISGDGRFVAFDSVATRLVRGDANERSDVFVWDRTTRATRRISESPRGEDGNGSSVNPAISADGGAIAFQSAATNLVEGGDANGAASDVYVYRADTGRIARVSLTDEGRQPAGGSHFEPAISGNGRLVAFTSSADLGCPRETSPDRTRSTLVANTNVYIRDLDAGRTRCVSVAADGGAANGRSFSPALDGGGNRIAYVTEATNPGDAGRSHTPAVVLRDLRSGRTELVSHTPNGHAANGPSSRPAISSAGRYVAFVSAASDLLCGRRCSPEDLDRNLLPDVYLFDTASGAVERVSTGGGSEWWAASRGPALDAAARVIVFSSSQPVSRDDVSGDEDLFIVSARRSCR